MDEAKRTFESEDLGPVVKKEANRCIVCMRCVRYCDEVIGDDALTAHQRGVWTEISSFNRQPLECEQCGNCVEVLSGRRAHRAALPFQGAALGPAPARDDLPVVQQRLLGASRRARATRCCVPAGPSSAA